MIDLESCHVRSVELRKPNYLKCSLMHLFHSTMLLLFSRTFRQLGINTWSGDFYGANLKAGSDAEIAGGMSFGSFKAGPSKLHCVKLL
jgi:hypothetical protein